MRLVAHPDESEFDQPQAMRSKIDAVTLDSRRACVCACAMVLRKSRTGGVVFATKAVVNLPGHCNPCVSNIRESGQISKTVKINRNIRPVNIAMKSVYGR